MEELLRQLWQCEYAGRREQQAEQRLACRLFQQHNNPDNADRDTVNQQIQLERDSKGQKYGAENTVLYPASFDMQQEHPDRDGAAREGWNIAVEKRRRQHWRQAEKEQQYQNFSDPRVFEQHACDGDKRMVLDEEPEEIHLLQRENGITLRFPAQRNIDNAEKNLGIEHIAQLKRETVKIVFLQNGIIPQRSPLRTISHEEGVAVDRGTQLGRGNIRSAQEKDTQQQDLFHGAGIDGLTAAVKDIARQQQDRENDDVKKDVVVKIEDPLA